MHVLNWLVHFWLVSVLCAAEDSWAPEIFTSRYDGFVDIFHFEDSPNMILKSFTGVYLSKDNGKNWELLDLKDESGNLANIIEIKNFEYFPNAALIIAEGRRHFITFDGCQTWKDFDIDGHVLFLRTAQINYANPDFMLFSFAVQNETGFKVITLYTKDGLRTPLIEVDEEKNLTGCTFTHINPYFTAGDDSAIICVKREQGLLESSYDTLISTTDFFNSITSVGDSELESVSISAVHISGLFVTVTVRTDRFLGDSVAMYTSIDGIHFYKAIFENQKDAIMIDAIDSSSGLLYVSLWKSAGAKKDLVSSDVYKSDSEGRHFKKIMEDVNIFGFAKLNSLDGVWIASQNKASGNFFGPKTKSKTKITYDDGMTWTYLNVTGVPGCLNDDKCSLHIHGLEGSLHNVNTPGIILGSGNYGEYLESDRDKLQTFVSRDGGLTWKLVHKTPSISAYGDVGNILLTAPFSRSGQSSADHFSYSLDQGESWTDIKLDKDLSPVYFINNKDNTDKVFSLVSLDTSDQESLKTVVTTIDFTNAFTETCTEIELEEWFARVDPVTNKQVCVYGHSEKFKRRKIDAKCFVNRNYEDLKAIETPCECTIDDTECNFGFFEDESGSCKPDMNVLSAMCDSSKGSKKLASRRKVPGNLCEGGYSPPQDDFTLKCKDAMDNQEKNKINVKLTQLNEHILYYQYLDKNSTEHEVQEETLFVLTASRQIYLSYDGGISFDVFEPSKSFISIFTNPYWPDSVHLVTDAGEVFTSLDRGRSFSNNVSPYTSGYYKAYALSFNARSPSVFILYSGINCDTQNNCEWHASITEDAGITYSDLLEGSNRCVFADSIFDSNLYDIDASQVICLQQVEGETYARLLSTSNKENQKVLFEKIIGFTTSNKYLVVARINDDGSLTAFVSVDGKNFADVRFPHDVNVDKQTAYTILETNSEELFFHLTTFDELDREFGALLKANYNGTLFTKSINYVNRNTKGFADFESVYGLEGLSLVNVVINPEEVKEGAEKVLVSKISHNDGANWLLLDAPARDANGKTISCKGCSLHLHSYTERLDPARDSFSSQSALGLMFGLGNVGAHLSPLDGDDVALYFTNDGGISWKEVVKGRYIWEFGDQGTILVAVETIVETDTLLYSLNYGETWNKYVFSPDKKYVVEDLATVPSDTSLEFILIVKDADVSHSIFTVDFTNVYSSQCILPFGGKDILSSDYEYFTPKYPTLKTSCLFGHETKYLRRKQNAECFIGLAPLNLGMQVVSNCQCTREDYECDYNYELAIDGTCRLVEGLNSLKGDDMCRKDGVKEWWEPTGYRKLTRSTCEDGLVLDKWNSHACPGYESEKNKLGGWSMFWIIFVPLVAFGIALTFVYEKGIRRNGGFSRLGEIRLDEDDNLHLIEENQTDKIINSIVKFGVFSFILMSKLWNKRSSFFSRFRGDYERPNGSIGAFFNDMVDDDHSLFGGSNDDEDAREIDSFLGQNQSQHDDFDDFVTHSDEDMNDNTEIVLDENEVEDI